MQWTGKNGNFTCWFIKRYLLLINPYAANLAIILFYRTGNDHRWCQAFRSLENNISLKQKFVWQQFTPASSFFKISKHCWKRSFVKNVTKTMISMNDLIQMSWSIPTFECRSEWVRKFNHLSRKNTCIILQILTFKSGIDKPIQLI